MHQCLLSEYMDCSHITEKILPPGERTEISRHMSVCLSASLCLFWVFHGKKVNRQMTFHVSRVRFHCVIFTCAVFFPLNEGEMTAQGKHMYMITGIGTWTQRQSETNDMLRKHSSDDLPKAGFLKEPANSNRTCHLPHGCVSCACSSAKCDASDHHDNSKSL